jgi:glycosyltransferase involved in cell wall biosynthesis
MNIYYWSPHTSYVATIKSVINSAKGLAKYGKNYQVSIIDANGEWDNLDCGKVNFLKIYNNIFIKTFPIDGYLKSRLGYLYIFFFRFLSLKNLIKKNKPDFLFIQLISSLPLILLLLFKFDTKFILRISGYPKLSFFRKIIWKLANKKLHLILCPTKATLDLLKEKNIFNPKKLFLLEDPVFRIREVNALKKHKISEDLDYNCKYILSIGRLTYQKNFNLLIEGFREIKKIYNEYKLIILGEGEKRLELEKLVKKLNLEKDVLLLGFKNNIFNYLEISDCLISTALWEDPGFALIETGILDKIVISSNCPNGPIELFNDNNGYLFNNNDKVSLVNAFIKYKDTSFLENVKKKIITKKKFKKYSFFNHYLKTKEFLI